MSKHNKKLSAIQRQGLLISLIADATKLGFTKSLIKGYEAQLSACEKEIADDKKKRSDWKKKMGGVK